MQTMDSFAAASPPPRSDDGSASAYPRAHASAIASSIEHPSPSIRDRTALLVPFRMASIRRTFSPARRRERAYDGHRAADCGLEPELPALALRQRE